MDLKRRIVESIERKLRLKDEGSLEPSSLFNTIRRMKIIERLLDGKGME
jgi:hypothetical protein